MLLSKNVTLKWNSKNKKYYELKGYKYTKMNAAFKVEIKDLSYGSKAMVKCSCDYCGDIYFIAYRVYLRGIKFNNKTSCNKCRQTKRIEGEFDRTLVTSVMS